MKTFNRNSARNLTHRTEPVRWAIAYTGRLMFPNTQENFKDFLD